MCVYTFLYILWHMRGRRTRKMLFWECIFGECDLVRRLGKAWGSWDLSEGWVDVNNVKGRADAKALWREGSWCEAWTHIWCGLNRENKGQDEVHEAGRIQTMPGHISHIKESHKDHCPLSPNVQYFETHYLSYIFVPLLLFSLPFP